MCKKAKEEVNMEGGLFDEAPSVTPGSIESVRSELDLFSVPATDVSSDSSSDYMVSFPLVSVRDSHAPIEFAIETTNGGYWSPLESFLSLTCRVVQQNGDLCEAADVVAPASLFLHSFISNVELYINSTCAYDSSGMYPYIGTLNRLLATNPVAKGSSLKDEFYYPNKAPDTFLTTDTGFNARYEQTKNSTPFVVWGQLVGSIFSQPRYLPPGTSIRLVLRRSLPEFHLDCNSTTKAGVNGCPYRVDVVSAEYYSSRKVVSPQVLEFHRKQLFEKHLTLKYPVNDYVVRTIAVAEGLDNATSESIAMGRLPRFLVIGQVSQTAFSGALNKSPFNFQTKKLKEVTVTWNDQNIENRIFPLSFQESVTKNSVTTVTGYNSFALALRGIQKTAASESLLNGIDRDNFTNGIQSCVIIFGAKSSLLNSSHLIMQF